jgi:uncharacterized membrane protein
MPMTVSSKLQHHERVAGPDDRERMVESGALAVRTSQTLVEVDAAVGAEVLGVGGATCIADQVAGHDASMCVKIF